MDSRRKFIGQVATGLAGTLAAGSAKALGASERIRVGVIGAGDRGMELVQQVRACANADVTAFADVVPSRLERATTVVPGAIAHADYRSLLDDATIDAVFIATPQHLHGPQFCDALAAGKHIYLEKTAALSLAQAKRMRAAYRAASENVVGKRVVQIGHQACSSGHLADVKQFLSEPSRMGKITAIAMQMHRATPLSKPPWARPALMTSDLKPTSVAWDAFLGGEAPAREFDAHRLIHWRYFWDYSGGSVFENMSQQLCFWYKALDLKIPAAATMDGGVYLWKDGREVPDTVSVSLQQPEEIQVSWVSGQGNNQPGASEDVLGTHGSILRASQVRYVPQKLNRPDGNEMTGKAAQAPHAHVADFFDAIRTGKEPSCPFELGYRVSVACRMALESYHQWRTVRWDAEREELL
jgi:predicted dehydrogenase